MLFPSPCKNTLELKHGGDVQFINLYSATGSKLLSIKSPEQTYTLNTSEWPAGLYFAEFYSGNSNPKTIKFIKSE
jgi:hypothetical protein